MQQIIKVNFYLQVLLGVSFDYSHKQRMQCVKPQRHDGK